jgi:MFS family permease
VAPVLGGALIHWGGWPWIFLVNLPVGLLALAGAWRIPEDLPPGAVSQRHPFDVAGFLGLGCGLALLTYASSEGVQRGWLSQAAWPFWAAGALLLAAYAIWAKRAPHPIVDTGPVRSRQQVLAMALVALVSVVTFALIVLVPTYLEEFLGQTALTAGLVLVPQGITTGLGAVLGNFLPTRLGVRSTILLGMAVLTASTLGMLLSGASTPDWLPALLLSGRGFAIGLVIQPLLNRLIGELPSEQVSDGNTLFNIVDRIAGSVGISLLITLFQLREAAGARALAHHLGAAPAASGVLAPVATAAFHDVVALSAVLAAFGFLLALGISGRATTAPDAG